MGLCFSKKKPPAKPGKIAVAVSDDKAKKPAPQQPKRAAATANKAAVFVVRPGSSSAKDAATAAPREDPKKKRSSGSSQEPAAQPKQLPVVLVPSAPVRTSSCTKEEVDAILIQCGRLSRSSSGAGRAASSSGETGGGGGGGGGGHRRRRSGSKRSYDFDQEARGAGGGADEECDWERQGVSRPSPHRGSPQRKRSGSRERSGTGSGSRRASRSPGRRADGAATSVATAGSGGGDRTRQQQPGKMVSVPAREKGRAPSPAAAAGKRPASPRSSSPARIATAGNENAGGGPAAGPTPVLSRSSSRRNEQSPYRRNPMAELDENSLRSNSNHSAKPQKKSTETAVAATPKKATGRGKEPTAVPSSCSGKEKPEIAEEDAAVAVAATGRGKEPTAVPSSCSGKEKPEIAEEDAAVAVAASETRVHSSKTNATRTVSIVAESLTTQRPGAQPGCRSRRASRDFDQNPGSYTTQLLEDIHNYHQQSTSAATPATPSFSLPACVAKACSIVEAVADLNSSSSENRTYEYEPGHSADDKGSVNAPAGSDDLVEQSAAGARKHLLPPVRDVRAETEPQESAGSNSVSGHPWTPSWEPTSVESPDRTWSTGDEVVEQSGGSHGGRCSPMNRPRQSKQRQSQQPELSGRSRAGSGNGNGQYRGRSAHRGSGSVASGRSGVRVVSANS